jgi:hypothetical protein
MRGKTMWAITAHTAKDLAEVEPMLGTLRLTADYLGMNWGGELLAYGNRPGEVDLETRHLFNQPADLAS